MKTATAPTITYTIDPVKRVVTFHGWFAGGHMNVYPHWCDKQWTFRQVADLVYSPDHFLPAATLARRQDAMSIARDELIDRGLIED